MLDEKTIHTQFEASTDRELLMNLAALLRPKKLKFGYESSIKLEQLTEWLQSQPQQRYRLRKAITNSIGAANMQYIFSESGLLTSSGFFAEFQQKLVSKLLPSLLPDNDLRITIREIFHDSNDYKWLNMIQVSAWFQFFKTMKLNVHFENALQFKQLLHAAEILSYRIAALGLDHRITSKAGKILQPHNAFVDQNKEWLRYRLLADNGDSPEGQAHSYSRMLQWIDMALRQIKEFRKQKREKGTSLQQTYLTERLEQHLLRLQTLITIIDPSIEVNPQQYTNYFKEVVENENTHNKLWVFLSRNFSFLAYQIAEHGSRTGEKYITNNFKEYRQFIWSAAIGGFIISLAAFIKVELTNLHLPYFWASFCYGLNYAIAFSVIHFLGGTIATKQPALTASTIATALDNTNPKSPSLHNLALMNAKVIRSQLASLFGNLVIVLPLTIFIAWGIHQLTGDLLIPVKEIPATLDTVRPHFTNIWFAAIAGVLLFLSGIVSGYFDNMVIYGNIPKRLLHHRGLRQLLGEKLLTRIAAYIDKNLGAIMGNVLLGFGLGFMIFFGKIFGFPLDIRHVTISTGFYGFAWYSSGFSFGWDIIAWCFTGLAIIAFTNLLVSFSLALYTALKSRGVASKQLLPLARLTIKYFFTHPLDFILPPKKERRAPIAKTVLYEEAMNE
jgi:site-specific recombinase